VLLRLFILLQTQTACRRRAVWLAALGPMLGVVSWAGYNFWNFEDRISGFFAGLAIGCFFGAALLWWTPDMSDAAPKAAIRRYQRQIAVTMGAYVLVMLVWKRLLDAVDPTWLKVFIALFPAALVCWVMRAFVQYVRDLDEMQRRIELESGAIAALLVSAVYLAAGFLQSAKLIHVAAGPALIFVFPAMCLLYGVSKIFVSRRYL
jgi:hypothetical protein